MTFLVTEYSDESFSELDMSGEKIQGISFYHSQFKASRFIECGFLHCDFEDVEFCGCDFSLSQFLRVAFRDCRFVDCKLVGIDWTRVSLPFQVEFKSSVLNSGLFTRMNLRGITMIRCQIQKCDFSMTNLADAELRESDFTGSGFDGTDLVQSDFRQATNYRINPQINKVKGAKFSLPEAISLLQGFGVVVTD